MTSASWLEFLPFAVLVPHLFDFNTSTLKPQPLTTYQYMASPLSTKAMLVKTKQNRINFYFLLFKQTVSFATTFQAHFSNPSSPYSLFACLTFWHNTFQTGLENIFIYWVLFVFSMCFCLTHYHQNQHLLIRQCTCLPLIRTISFIYPYQCGVYPLSSKHHQSRQLEPNFTTTPNDSILFKFKVKVIMVLQVTLVLFDINGVGITIC